ncbi:hypothetical protein SNEBB_004263 [Seison nebaliae]|nr:hypothetical protein SNEBB_004263 [Seison nebaliae]
MLRYFYIYLSIRIIEASSYKLLYDDLMQEYDPAVRPVENATDAMPLFLGVKLLQLIGIDEKNQIMTTNVRLYMSWIDTKLKWNPARYGGIETMYLPSKKIWLPDIVLYNNADGHYEVYIYTRVEVSYTGKVIWLPPVVYKSYCPIEVDYFPFDQQECYLKFSTWSYDGNNIDLQHMNAEHHNESIAYVNLGWDLSEYVSSVEWDIMAAPAERNVHQYECCPEPYIDIFFRITLRRKTLFYSVNLIIPCVAIAFLTVLVFNLPSGSGEKINLAIVTLVLLTFFLLLLIEIVPPTSLAIPLLGQYLLMTMILINLSIVVTVMVLNLHHRSPSSSNMPSWMRIVFIDVLPTYLLIRRPQHRTLSDISLVSDLHPHEKNHSGKKYHKETRKEHEEKEEIRKGHEEKEETTQNSQNIKDCSDKSKEEKKENQIESPLQYESDDFSSTKAVSKYPINIIPLTTSTPINNRKFIKESKSNNRFINLQLVNQDSIECASLLPQNGDCLDYQNNVLCSERKRQKPRRNKKSLILNRPTTAVHKEFHEQTPHSFDDKIYLTTQLLHKHKKPSSSSTKRQIQETAFFTQIERLKAYKKRAHQEHRCHANQYKMKNKGQIPNVTAKTIPISENEIRQRKKHRSTSNRVLNQLKERNKIKFDQKRIEEKQKKGLIALFRCREVKKAMKGIDSYVKHIKDEDDDIRILGDWQYLSLVFDRIFLILFTVACTLGTILVMCNAPSLYDKRETVTELLRKSNKISIGTKSIIKTSRLYLAAK